MCILHTMCIPLKWKRSMCIQLVFTWFYTVKMEYLCHWKYILNEHTRLEVYIYPRIYLFQTTYTPQHISYTPFNSTLCTPYYILLSTPCSILYTHRSKIYYFPNNILHTIFQTIYYVLFSKLVCSSTYSSRKHTTDSSKVK